MDVRLVAYRRETTSDDTFDVTQFELDLQQAPNVVVNYNWLDLKNPDTRKSSFSQTLKLPFSNANNDFFENYFDVNLESLVYNAKTKFSAILYIDSIPQLKGFIQLKSIYMNARLYEVALFGDTADFFTELKDNKLKDAFRVEDTTTPELYLLSKILDHKLTLANVLASWTTGLTTVLSTTTNDIMYPVFDYGHTYNPYSSAMFWNPDDWIGNINELGNVNGVEALNYYGMVKIGNLKPAIRIQRLLHIIAAKSGYTIKSTFLGIDGDSLTNTDWFSRLFMTCSTESQRVQTLFNTSAGSEAPFIGFEAQMTSAQTETAYTLNNPDNTIVNVDYFFGNLIVNNEIYDPNNLYFATTLQTLNIGWNISTTVNSPSIQIPADTGLETLLPTGNLTVETTINLTLPAQTIQGNDYSGSLIVRWYDQATLNEQGDYVNISGLDVASTQEISISAGTTQDYVFTNNLIPTPGSVYFCVALLQSTMSGADQTINITTNSCTIRTLQTDDIGLMGGGENGEVQMYHNMPDITQADFVKDLVNRFNLIIQTDPDNEKLLLIEPYQDYINAGSTQYWTDKLDVSKEQVIRPTNELQSKELIFGDLEDEDFLNQRYNSIYNTVYGTYKETRRNDFASNDFKNFSVMSPLIAQGVPYWNYNGIGNALPTQDIATAYLFKAAEGEVGEPLEQMKPKLFYYSGTPVNVTGSNPIEVPTTAYNFHIYSNHYTQTTNAIDTNNKFPLCTQYNLDTIGSGITANTKLLHWTWYNPNFNTGFTFNYFGTTYSEHGFYTDYWAQYINEIYSDEARIMECYLNLDPVDIRRFAGTGFQDVYYIKNTLWRIISVDNYLVGGNKSTRVTLLKVIEKLTNDCGAIPTFTNTGLMTWVDAGSGASTTITNTCCEEVNPDWTFVQTNASTGVGDCYSQGGSTTTTTTNTIYSDNINDGILPALMPNIQNNNLIVNSNGYAQSMGFYLEATTLGTNTTTFNFNGTQDKIFRLKFLSISYVKMKIVGTVRTGTNAGKIGYFEYDTVLVYRTGGVSNVGGTTALKQNKDTDFTAPTLNLITVDDNAFWKPTITGGANEEVNWICEAQIMSKSIAVAGASNVRAIYQNANNILYQDLDYLIWN